MFLNDYSDWEVIPEEKIRQALEMCQSFGSDGDEDLDNFQSVLSAGEVFKEADMTPVYVFCDVTCRLAVYAAETHGKLLH